MKPEVPRYMETLRKIDEMGRVTLPRSVRERYELEVGDYVELFTETRGVLLRKYRPGCIFCGGLTDKQFSEYLVCNKCAGLIAARYDEEEIE